MRSMIAATTALSLLGSTPAVQAFCGFYVSGSDKKMFADATNVVLMRSGTRTILSMQNDYRGPLEDFAMVIPVPVVLKQTDVRVVQKAVFDRMDSLGSPRLVEYWEEDPCPPPEPVYKKRPMPTRSSGGARPSMKMDAPSADMGRGGGGDYSKEAERMAVAPILGSFAVNPPSVTAGLPTNVTWSFQYSNQPYPEPTCTIDNKVGNVYNGMATSVTIDASTNFKITCANSAGRTSKEARINV